MNKFIALAMVLLGLGIATPVFAGDYHGRHDRSAVTSFSFSITVGRDRSRHRPGYHSRRGNVIIIERQRTIIYGR